MSEMSTFEERMDEMSLNIHTPHFLKEHQYSLLYLGKNPTTPLTILTQLDNGRSLGFDDLGPSSLKARVLQTYQINELIDMYCT
mmetsp:Transcript_27982/g.45409  ORF Transcript_27982/g.45409 Transcript_27982/m.45409 type:complete len:84 (-) Transcript_27982:989-1240(-)